jgi:hypothetical protein
MKLDVNTDASIELTAKLERINRSAFPSAVRNTLNGAAFKTKKLVPKKASLNFTIRQKSLFRKFVLVDKAQGFNVNTMKSVIGLRSTGGKDRLIDGLVKQELGGVVDKRRLVAHDKARISGSNQKKIRKKNYLSNFIGRVGTPKKRVKGSKYIMINGSAGKKTIFEVKNKKLTPIFTVRNTDKTRLKKRPFLRPVAVLVSKKIPQMYKNNAEFQFKKYLK